ncbi:putative bifunctional diguanylate cyclase/phosphodiesterase [Zoogloea sp.]|uniref:putative bifunctional diguanylate cyclase/phosphodiesterase n=1 Tax=Zoogloea sp. TaxID=49181 RepID=UPI0035B01FF5
MLRLPEIAAPLPLLLRYWRIALICLAINTVGIVAHRDLINQSEQTAQAFFLRDAKLYQALLQHHLEQLASKADLISRQLSLNRQYSNLEAVGQPILHSYPDVVNLGVLVRKGAQIILRSVEGPACPPTGTPFLTETCFPELRTRQTLEHSLQRAEEKLSTSGTVWLQDRNTNNQRAFLFSAIAAPQGADNPQRALVFIELDLTRLLATALRPAVEGQAPSLNVHLNSPQTSQNSAPPSGPFIRTTTLRFGDQDWELQLTPQPGHYYSSPGIQAYAPLAASLLVSLLVAWLGRVLETRASAIQAQVEEQTESLENAKEALENLVKIQKMLNLQLQNEVAQHAHSVYQLRETTQLQQAILDCAEYAILYTDPQGIIQRLNPASINLFAYAHDELIGLHVQHLFPPLDTGQAPPIRTREGQLELNLAISEKFRVPQEVELVRKNGSRFTASLSISVVRSPEQQVLGFVGIVLDLTEKIEAEMRIRHLAHYDSLTALPNRSRLNEHLAQMLELATQTGQGLAVMFTDLDRFKYVNDTLGHQAGDELLQLVSQRLKHCVREQDLVARTGGDEFVIVLSPVEDPTHAAREVADRLLLSLARPFTLCGKQITVTPSIGIALYPEHGEDGNTLIKHADAAMYLAKDSGRNNLQFFHEGLGRRYTERLDLENRLRQALEQKELDLYYQPQVDSASGELIGMEALVRWPQADGSMIPPDKFIPIAEESGLIVPMGAWVLQRACEQTRSWLNEGLGCVPVGVNLSARQFDDPELLSTIRRTLSETGLGATYLDLELTESLVMRNPEHTRNVLADCKKLGLRLSVDDFGTGYSSLANLKRFPIDRLKIDRSFIKDIVTEADDAAIARTIIAMAHTLRLEVVAEGVETTAQLELLQQWNCDAYQGYLCSRPLPAAQITQLLRAYKSSRLLSLHSI